MQPRRFFLVVLALVSLTQVSRAETPFPTRVWIHHSTGNGFEYQSKIQTLGDFREWEIGKLGNFDGEGAGDLLRIGYSREQNLSGAWVHVGAAAGFETSHRPFYQYPNHYRHLVGDVNRDGKDDLIGISPRFRTGKKPLAEVTVYLSDGRQFNRLSPLQLAEYWEEQQWLMGDVNGDGKADLVNVYAGSKDFARAWVHLSTGKSFEFKSSFTTLAKFWTTQRWMLGDIDGDGKADLVNVYGGKKNVAVAWVHLSSGKGFEYKSSFTKMAGFWEKQRWFLGDVNGDRKADLVNLYPGDGNKARVWVHHSTGSGFEYQSSLETLAGYAETQSWNLGDVNGDGKADLVNLYRGPLTPPNAPRNLTVENVAGRDITISWSHDKTRTDGYVVTWVGKKKFHVTDRKTVDVGRGQSSFTITKRHPGLEYRITVQAYNGGGKSPASNEVVVTIPAQAQAPPSPQTQVYYFKLTNPQSRVNPCFVTAVRAETAEQARELAHRQAANYSITQITAEEYFDPNTCKRR